MSGGSYEYLQGKMEDGDVTAFMRYASSLLRDLRTLEEKIDACGHNPKTFGFDVPYPRREAGLISIAAVRNRVEMLQSKVTALLEEMNSLAPVVHDIEWWQSGDYRAEQAIDGCVQWMEKLLAGEK